MFITFLTDFGLQDDFVGTCHGVIKRIAPDAQIIDITHGIPAQAVLQGALVLANTLPYMPVGVHLAVVDPGVGGHRRPLALRDADGRSTSAPTTACSSRGRARRHHRGARARQSRVRARVGLAHVPRAGSLLTAAAHLASGVADRRARPADRSRRGSSGSSCLSRPSRTGVVHATTLYVDSFGNIALNLTRDDLDRVGVVPGAGSSWSSPASGTSPSSARTFADARAGDVILSRTATGTCRSRSRTGTQPRCCTP